MKKLLMMGLCLMGVSGAQSEVDCSTVMTPAFLGLSYNTTLVFPEPAKSTIKLFGAETFNVKVCDYTFVSQPDKGLRSIDAPTLPALAKTLSGGKSNRIAIPMYTVSGYRYPTIKQDFQYFHLSATYNIDSRLLTAETNSAFKDKTLAYKLDGGPLKPLYFDGKASPIIVPIGVKKIEIFGAQADASTEFQHLILDLEAASVSGEKRFPFPKN